MAKVRSERLVGHVMGLGGFAFQDCNLKAESHAVSAASCAAGSQPCVIFQNQVFVFVFWHIMMIEGNVFMFVVCHWVIADHLMEVPLL